MGILYGIMNCPKCNTPLVEKNGKNGPFLACPNYPDCKHTENVDAAKRIPKDNTGIQVVGNHKDMSIVAQCLTKAVIGSCSGQPPKYALENGIKDAVMMYKEALKLLIQ